MVTVPDVYATGQRVPAVQLNQLVTAMIELQAALPGFTSARPQLRVFAPASVTVSQKVPYATVRKDTHSGWNTTNKEYTVPVSGLWLVAFAYKCSSSATTPSQYFAIGGSSSLSGSNTASAAYMGASLSGVLDLVAGDVCSVVEQAVSYTPQNDTTTSKGTGSNYLHMTYLGLTT